jgi:hypothetical protein
MRLLTSFIQMFSRILRGTVVVFVVSLGLHSVSAQAGSGLVLDEGTKKPLVGVYIWAEWHAGVVNPAISKSKCYAFAMTQTDEKGKFKLRDFSWNFEPWLYDRRRGVGYYLAGYELVEKGDTDPSIVYMRRYVGAPLKYLRSTLNGVGEDCIAVNGRKILLPLYKAMYEEAKIIAISPEEKVLATYFKNKIGRIEENEK